MRINVYHHELHHMLRTEVVRKKADTGSTFYGVRFYTEPPLMHQSGDDDSSAITLWVPWSRAEGHNTEPLRSIAAALTRMCDEIDKEVARD